MEMTLNNGFCEMSQDELNVLNGGGGKEAAAVFVGTVCVAWAPVAAFVPGIGLALAGAMALGGAGLIGKGTGAY